MIRNKSIVGVDIQFALNTNTKRLVQVEKKKNTELMFAEDIHFFGVIDNISRYIGILISPGKKKKKKI